MRYCILGAGVQGSATAAVVARAGDAEAIVLADRDARLADRVAEKIGCDVLTTAATDAADVASIVRAADGCDIILNLVDPDFNGQARKAALQAGCHYIDSAASLDFMMDVGFRRHVPDDEGFRAAGLCALVMSGFSPGVTNALTRRTTDSFDEVEAIYVRLAYPEELWVDGNEVAHAWRPHWSPEGMVRDFAQPSMVLHSGELTLMGPWANREVFDFGKGMGKRVLTSHSHEEAATLPVFIGKGIGECDFLYAVNDQVATLIATGFGDPDREVELAGGTKVKPFDVLMALARRPAETAFFDETPDRVRSRQDIQCAISIEVVGRKHGIRERIVTAWDRNDSSALRVRLFEHFGTVNVWVAVPMLASARLVARGDVPSGVTVPEQLDPELFLRELTVLQYPLDLREERVVLPDGPLAEVRATANPPNPTPLERRPV